MIKLFKSVFLAALVLGAGMLAFNDAAYCSSKDIKEVASLDRKIERLRKKLARRFAKLNSDDKSSVLSRRHGKSEDSDSDGVPDSFEDSHGRCDSDSDDDGIDDGSEYDRGLNPGDDDSDDDGVPDSMESEEKGLISSLSSTEVVVNSQAFVITQNTQFLSRRKETLTINDFAVGQCVEAEGHISGNSVVAEKVKKDNDC